MQNVYFPLCSTFSCPTYPVLPLTDRFRMQNKCLMLFLDTSALIQARAWGICGSARWSLQSDKSIAHLSDHRAWRKITSVPGIWLMYFHTETWLQYFGQSLSPLRKGSDIYPNFSAVTHIPISKVSQHFIIFNTVISWLYCGGVLASWMDKANSVCGEDLSIQLQ